MNLTTHFLTCPQIITALEEDPTAQKMQLGYRLQQIAAAVENKVTDLWQETPTSATTEQPSRSTLLVELKHASTEDFFFGLTDCLFFESTSQFYFFSSWKSRLLKLSALNPFILCVCGTMYCQFWVIVRRWQFPGQINRGYTINMIQACRHGHVNSFY